MAVPGYSQAAWAWPLIWEPRCDRSAVWMRAPSVVRGLETVVFEESF